MRRSAAAAFAHARPPSASTCTATHLAMLALEGSATGAQGPLTRPCKGPLPEVDEMVSFAARRAQPCGGGYAGSGSSTSVRGGRTPRAMLLNLYGVPVVDESRLPFCCRRTLVPGCWWHDRGRLWRAASPCCPLRSRPVAAACEGRVLSAWCWFALCALFWTFRARYRVSLYAWRCSVCSLAGLDV